MKSLESVADKFGYNPDDWHIDDQEYALALLMIMEDFVRNYENKSYNYIKNHYVKDIDKLEEKMLKTNDRYFDKMCDNHFKTRALSYKIPSSKQGKIPRTYDLEATKNVIIKSIKNITRRLRDEIDETIQVVEDTAYEFNISRKLKDAIKKTKGAVEYGSRIGGEKSRRDVDGFVYGGNVPFKWVTCGDSRVCEWCLMQERLPPKPLKDWEFDHPYGRCTLEPANDETTEAFNELLGID